MTTSQPGQAGHDVERGAGPRAAAGRVAAGHHPHGADRRRRQHHRHDRQAGGRDPLRLQRHAGRGGPLVRGHPQPGVPVHLGAPGPAPGRRGAPVRVRAGAVLLVAAGRVRDLHRGRGILDLRGHPLAEQPDQRLPDRVCGAGRVRHRRGHLVHPGLRPAPGRGPPQPHAHAGARQDQPGHHGQGGAVRGHRRGHRARAGRRRPAAGAAHRLPRLRRGRLDRDRGAADRGGLPAGHGQPGTAHRPGRRPQGARSDPRGDREDARRGPSCCTCRPCTWARTA